jgi:protein-tyrosine-phosphatase
MPERMLFVCSGNTCRSPLAEAIARKVASEMGVEDIEFGSAGTGAWDGAPASDGALLVGIERGLDLSGHRSRALTRTIVADADIVLTMGDRHLQEVEALGGQGKSYLLTAYAARSATGSSVGDPFGGGLEIYRTTAHELDREVRRAVARFVEDRRSTGEA